MNVEDAIKARRAFRALEPVGISRKQAEDLAQCAGLSASCFNNQPWRFVFVTDKAVLKGLHAALAPANGWASAGSMIVAVFTKKDLDCVLKDREYCLFDAGMASAHLILRATEMGLVAHPIAGYDEAKAKEALGIPAEFRLITLIIFGMHAAQAKEGGLLTAKQVETEKSRPERLPLEKYAFFDRYTGE